MRSTFFKNAKLKRISNNMEQALDYGSWSALAKHHDELSGRDQWKEEDECSLYDSAEIRNRHDNLSSLLSAGNVNGLLYALNEGVHGNMGGMGRPILYDKAKLGGKTLVDDYVSIIVQSLHEIAAAPDQNISFAEKLDFFRRASHCYGRSALMLSGGAGLIYYHHGVVQTLIDNECVPNVISGASAGSIVSAQLGTLSDEELKAGHFSSFQYDVPKNVNPLLVLAGLHEDYTTQSVKELLLNSFDSDMTFQEAFEKTGRYINISISPAEKHQTSRLMNAITSPNVYVRSAVDASASVPGVIAPVRLYAKGADGKPKPYLPSRKWCDGSFSEDLPAKRLARLFGVNHYMVSLINPLAGSFVKDQKVRRTRSLSSLPTEFLLDGVKELLLRTEDSLSKYGSSFASPAILLAHAVLDQEYTGDVNMILSKKDFHWRNVLFKFNRESEIENLILTGRRHAWPKLAAIKNSIAISKTLDGILAKMDLEELDSMSVPHKAHLTTVM